MRLRSFHGANLQDAMKQVREALGADAIIVATREDDGGGVRVTAALDETAHQQPAKKEETVITKAQAPVTATSAAAPAAPPITYDVVDLCAEQMMRHGVPATLAEPIMAVVTHFAENDVLIALGAAMDRHFRFAPLLDGLNRPLCMVGPPGAGKTMAVAKLAAIRVLSKKTLGVITTDLSRAGAIEQLAAYTKMMKVSLIEVEDDRTLKDAIDTHRRNDLILVDNAGRNPFDAKDMDSLKKLIVAGNMEPVLIMPAGMDAAEATDMARAFMEIGVEKVVLTKVDLARRLGSMLAMAHDTGLQLCGYCHSPKVTDGIDILNPVTLARLLLPPEIAAQLVKPNNTTTTSRVPA